LALFFAVNVLERHSPRISFDREYDLVFHIDALIGVNAFGSEHVAVADVNEPPASLSLHRLGDEIFAELETLTVDASDCHLRPYAPAAQRKFLKIRSVFPPRFDSPLRQMIRNEFGRHIKPA